MSNGRDYFGYDEERDSKWEDPVKPEADRAKMGRELMEGTGPLLTDGGKGKPMENGFTPLQEAFCRMVAQQPEDLCTSAVLGRIYASLPGVKTGSPDAAALVLMKLDKIKDHINAYRAIMRTDRLELLARREKITQVLWKKFEEDPNAKVKAADVLQMQRDLEAAYGLNKATEINIGEMKVILDNERVADGLKAINITPKQEEKKNAE
jgi:hypothetical protein